VDLGVALDDGLTASGKSGDAVVETAASPLDKVADLIKEIEYCTPGLGRRPSARFLTRFCRTQDEDGKIRPIPPWQFVLEDCQLFESRQDTHDEKTRQMLATTLTAGQHLWRTMFVKNSAGFITSRKEKLVDDGGYRSTYNSIMGRMRFMYDRLPDLLKEYAPVEFSKLRISCERTGSYTVGEGATGEAGRSGTWWCADVDEAAFLEGDSWFRALRSACPKGLRMRSTPNGKLGIFPRIKFETPGDFVFTRKHWTRHPNRWNGDEYDEVTKRPTSEWYRRTSGPMTKDEVARELDISYAHSVAGQVWPEFDEDVHVDWDWAYDPSLPLYAGWDFGVAAATAVVFFQVHGREMWIVGDYEGWEGDPDDHAPAIWAKAQEIGFRGEKHEIRCYGDPAGNNRDQGNKNSTVMRAYVAHGFKSFSKAPRPPLKDSIRMVRRKWRRAEIKVYTLCSHVRRRVPDHRWRTDVDGRVAGGEVLVENESKHLCDAIRFGALGVYPIDEGYSADMKTAPLGAPIEQPKGWSRDVPASQPESWQRGIVGTFQEY